MVNRRFCYSRRWNDHDAYPRELVQSPPPGWTFRPTSVRFDVEQGRPWCQFTTRAGELIHASSLVPTNAVPWVLDTDSAEYLLEQAALAARTSGRSFCRRTVEFRLARAITDPRCMAIVTWSSAGRRSVLDLLARTGMPERLVAVAYPTAEPPANEISSSDRTRVASLLARTDPKSVILLAVDGQTGVCSEPGRKNIRDAIRVTRHLRSAGFGVELLVVAPSEDVPREEEGIHVVPRLSRAGLWEVYRQVDVLLFLSRKDSFGYVLLEAMRNGVCVIGAAGHSLPALREIIDPGQTGVLVEFRESRPYPELSDGIDFEGLINAVARLVRDEQWRSRLAGAAQRQFRPGGQFDRANRNATFLEVVREGERRLRMGM